MRLLVTRPQAEAERTAAPLRARGHEALIAPVLTDRDHRRCDIRSVTVDAIIMTSGNAARALRSSGALVLRSSFRFFAVGGQTAQAARDAGFSNVMSAEGDAADLLALAWPLGARRAVLYLAGSDRSRDLAAELAPAGSQSRPWCLQRDGRRAPARRGRTGDRTGTIDGVPHYSRRSSPIFSIARTPPGCTPRSRCHSLLPVAARGRAAFSQTIQAYQGRAASR